MIWQDYFNQYFYRLMDEEADLWEEEIMRKTPGIRKDDILSAVRQLSTTERPKLRHMLAQCAAIVKARTHGDNEPNPACLMCDKGWVIYRPPDGIYAVAGCSIPCLCTLGEKWRQEKYDPHHWPKLKRLAQQAAEQQSHEETKA